MNVITSLRPALSSSLCCDDRFTHHHHPSSYQSPCPKPTESSPRPTPVLYVYLLQHLVYLLLVKDDGHVWVLTRDGGVLHPRVGVPHLFAAPLVAGKVHPVDHIVVSLQILLLDLAEGVHTRGAVHILVHLVAVLVVHESRVVLVVICRIARLRIGVWI